MEFTFSPFQKMFEPIFGVELFSTKMFEQAPKISVTNVLSLRIALITFVEICATTAFPEAST